MSLTPTLSERMFQSIAAKEQCMRNAFIHNPMMPTFRSEPCWTEAERPVSVHAVRRETVTGTSYSALGYCQEVFVSLCRTLADEVPSVMETLGAEVFVVRGSSGVSVAFGMRMVRGTRFVVARKSGENSHAGLLSVVGARSCEVYRYVILDDFVGSGRTVRGIMDDMGKAECVGIISYADFDGHGHLGLRRHHARCDVPYFRFGSWE